MATAKYVESVTIHGKQAQLEIETRNTCYDKKTIRAEAAVYWMHENGLKSHSYAISKFGKGDFRMIAASKQSRATQKAIDEVHSEALKSLEKLRALALAHYPTAADIPGM